MAAVGIPLGVIGAPRVAEAFTRAGFEVLTDPSRIRDELDADPGLFPVWVSSESWADAAVIEAGKAHAWVSVGGPAPAGAVPAGELVATVEMPCTVVDLIAAAGGDPGQMVPAELQGLVIEADVPRRALWGPPSTAVWAEAEPAAGGSRLLVDEPDERTDEADDAPEPILDREPSTPVPPPSDRPFVAPIVSPQVAPVFTQIPVEQPAVAETEGRSVPAPPAQQLPFPPHPGFGKGLTNLPASSPSGDGHPMPAPAEALAAPPTTATAAAPLVDPEDLVDEIAFGRDRVHSAARRNGGQVVVTYGGRGGVGKTSLSHALAAEAAAKGLKVVLVDANIGQPDQLKLLGVDPRADLPSIMDAVDGDVTDAFAPPSAINAARDSSLIPVRFVLVPGPPRGRANHPGLTPELILAVVRHAQRVADLVVVDTQIIEDERDDSGMVRRLILPLLTTGAWGLGVADASRPGLAYLSARPMQLIAAGADQPRMLAVVNKVPDNIQLDAARLAERLRPVSRLMGIIPARQELVALSNRGQVLVGNPTLSGPVQRVLQLVCGLPVTAVDAREDRDPGPAPSHGKRFGWPFGRKAS